MGDDIAERLVEALYRDTPVAAGCRVNHARGLLVEGVFRPDPEARRLSKATTFHGPDLSVLARFSSSTGDPDIPEDAPNADPRGLAVAISDDFVLVGHSVEAFPASTPEEFLAFLEALNARDTDPERLEDHLKAHAAAARFVADRPPAATSFATLRYHMLHTYRLTRTEGSFTDGKLSVSGIIGAGNYASLPGADHLTGDLEIRLSRGVIELILEFTPVLIDSTIAKVHADATGAKGGLRLPRSAGRAAA